METWPRQDPDSQHVVGPTSSLCQSWGVCPPQSVLVDLTPTSCSWCHSGSFTDQEAEAQRGEVICPGTKSRTWSVWPQCPRFPHYCCSVAKSCLTLRPHGLQHSRLLCPSPSPRLCSNSCPLVSDAIQASHPLLSPSPLVLNLSQHQGLFK